MAVSRDRDTIVHHGFIAFDNEVRVDIAMDGARDAVALSSDSPVSVAHIGCAGQDESFAGKSVALANVIRHGRVPMVLR